MLTPNYKMRSRPIDLELVANSAIQCAKQFIANASIGLAEYSDPSFRANCLHNAIEALQRAERALVTQQIINQVNPPVQDS